MWLVMKFTLSISIYDLLQGDVKRIYWKIGYLYVRIDIREKLESSV